VETRDLEFGNAAQASSMSQAKEANVRIGLVGVGTMGTLIASALAKAGHRVVVCDVDPHAVQRAREFGAIAVDHPQNVAEQTDVILLVLPGPTQIEAAVTGDRGLLGGTQAGQVIVDMSTVDPATTRRMGTLAQDVGVEYLDAPILGRPSAFGSWVLPVGGEPAVVARCRPVLEELARKVIHVGPLGAGNTLKLLNALMFSAINAMTAEMMAVSMKAGLPPRVLFETIAESQAATVSGLFKEVGAKIVARDFAPVFSIDLLGKDNRLAIDMARACGAPPILASTVQVLNELASARGLGPEDTSALVKVYETLLDVEWDESEEREGPREV
jgi:3-hydroxyisobutyrate dehydrogenase-like beta-hydroxyacid dehydrogenase